MNRKNKKMRSPDGKSASTINPLTIRVKCRILYECYVLRSIHQKQTFYLGFILLGPCPTIMNS